MPGCAAIGCSNSSKKEFVMKCFPKDPRRRKEWAIKMRRDDWFPTDYSRLCEAHFAPDMWEVTREDGSRKLKVHAVPTIFAFMIPKPKHDQHDFFWKFSIIARVADERKVKMKYNMICRFQGFWGQEICFYYKCDVEVLI